MERPENFKVSINGKEISTELQNGFWIDKCFKRITVSNETLRIGKNSIELEVNFHEGINLEAIYIIGEFAVSLEESKKTLVSLPKKLNIGDITSQGLPFYSGKINYCIEVEQELNKDEKVFIAFDRLDSACIKINPGEEGESIIAWTPYEAEITQQVRENYKVNVEVILTRRNTFGPLHQIPIIAPSYGPDNFVTEGENFSINYMLVPSGIK